MANIKSRDFEKSLLRKGFHQEKSAHHIYYRFFDGEQRTGIHTYMSHGEKDFGDNLMGARQRQIYLNRQDFIRFVECPLTHSDYRKILIEKKIIQGNPQT